LISSTNSNSKLRRHFNKKNKKNKKTTDENNVKSNKSHYTPKRIASARSKFRTKTKSMFLSKKKKKR
jgi:hypothetical protein